MTEEIIHKYYIQTYIQYIFFFKSFQRGGKRRKNNKQTNYKYAWKFQKSWSVRPEKKGSFWTLYNGGRNGAIAMKWGGYDNRKGGTAKAAENYALQFLLLHCSLRPVWLLIAERKRQSEAVGRREREQGTVCIVCALFGRFRVNVNYQNCFGTWLTDSKPKAIKIFMTHWVITSNPQTWVMPRPRPLNFPYCLPPTHHLLLQSALKGREKFSWTERENLRPKAKRKCEKTPHNGRY